MAETPYPYSLSADFPNNAVNTETLESEILASSITRALERIDYSGDAVSIVFKDALTSGDRLVLDGNTTNPASGLILIHDHTPTQDLPNQVEISNVDTSSTAHLKVEVEPKEGTGINFYTPNLCDRTTWYSGSIPVSAFDLTDTGDLTSWNTNGSHDGPWIDLTHGKIFAEDTITALSAELLCKVETSTDSGVTWAEKTENTFDDADGDYSVNYVSGIVTFNAALSAGTQVRASFCKAPTMMRHIITPSPGKRIRIVHVETQISTDVGVTTNVNYEVWAYNPLDLPNKILIKKSVYKTLNDFLYESTGVYPVFPKIDATGARGIAADVVVVPFNYTASRDINHSQGVEVRVCLDKPFTGTVCNSTFYCLEEDE